MAGTKFAYVRSFELPDTALPSTYMVVRIDGKGFHKFSKAHDFVKPNDPQALELMNEAARYVMAQLKGQVSMAFGESDEYSFLLREDATLYSRRTSKITTHIVSLFTAAYLFNWPRFFPSTQLKYPPTFDGRLVLYPSASIVRDYFSWRQADTHINNLYNTTFWALVLRGGETEQQATETLRGTYSKDKHEILWRFGINYDKLEAIYRKGTTVVWSRPDAEDGGEPSKRWTSAATKTDLDDAIDALVLREGITRRHAAKRLAKVEKQKQKREQSAQDLVLTTLHCDIISDDFWSTADKGNGAGEAGQGADAEEESGVSGSSRIAPDRATDPATTKTAYITTADSAATDQPWLDASRLRCRAMGRFVL